MTNRASMIEKLRNGDFIILDYTRDEYPDFKDIHVFGSYGSSFTQHSRKIKELFSETDISDRIATGQAIDGTNYIYLYDIEDHDEDNDEDTDQEYVSMYTRVERYLKEKGHYV